MEVETIKFFFPDRKILICREISKFYEEYTRTSVNDLNNYFKPPKGELTVPFGKKRSVIIGKEIRKMTEKLED